MTHRWRLLLIALPLWAVAGCVMNTGKPQPTCPVPERMQIARDTQLDPACIYKTSIQITASGVTLDCRGALIDARGQQHGILVGGEKPVSQVTVRNCKILGGRNGVRVSWTVWDNKKAAQHDRQQLYELSPQQISLERLEVRDTEDAGIYIDDYTHHSRVIDSHIHGSGSTGIYLEHSSRDNEILNNVLKNNGYGQLPDLRLGAARREAIAVDSSAHNRIEGNHMEGNAAGGIFLYKNCQEHVHTQRSTVPRWQHASHNLIRGNTFRKERIGVWLASRQSRDLSTWDCGDQAYVAGKYYPDYAQYNTVTGNRFEGVQTGVLVEDDHNSIIGNTFVDTGSAVEKGARLRTEVTGKALQGLLIQDNVILP